MFTYNIQVTSSSQTRIRGKFFKKAVGPVAMPFKPNTQSKMQKQTPNLNQPIPAQVGQSRAELW